MTDLNIITFATKVYDGKDSKDVFVAMCMEHFLVAQGNTIAKALENLHLVIQGTLVAGAASGIGLSGIKPAPEVYQKKFEAIKASRNPVVTPHDLENIRSLTYSDAA